MAFIEEEQLSLFPGGKIKAAKKENSMTPMEAWSNVSRRLAVLDRSKGYTNEDLEAQVICFQALKEMEERKCPKKTSW